MQYKKVLGVSEFKKQFWMPVTWQVVDYGKPILTFMYLIFWYSSFTQTWFSDSCMWLDFLVFAQPLTLGWVWFDFIDFELFPIEFLVT